MSPAPPQEPGEPPSAFTVLEHEHEPRARHVLAVRPQRREPAPAPAPLGPGPDPLDPKFTRALDFKLRRLKDKELLQANLRRPVRPRRAPQAGPGPEPRPAGDPAAARVEPRRVRTDAEGERPRFVTTVKTGQFLLPPPPLASLLGLEALYPAPERNLVYSYASRPQAVPRARRAAPPEAPEPGPAPGPGPGLGPGGARHLFGSVRALVAGVVGMRHMLGDKHDGNVPGGTPASHGNMMHDKRVVRGSTFAAHPLAAGDGLESAAARAARTRRRALARRAAAARLRPGTPPPAPGRRHHPIQTEYYLEELFDKGVEMEVGVQTDLFVDRPATPVYVPAKTGADAYTQIYPGDLFDFDLEVQPVLEVLVGKTAEQALAEVAQEEELAALREQQRRYIELRDAERAERQRLAAHDLRLHHEKERRVAQARVAQTAAVEARERAAAAVLVQGYVAELLPGVLAGLRDQGYLMERIERGVDEEFMPWLVSAVSQEIESIITSRDVITEIVRDVVEARAELYRGAGEADADHVEPEQSLTPLSLPTGEGDEEEAPHQE